MRFLFNSLFGLCFPVVSETDFAFGCASILWDHLVEVFCYNSGDPQFSVSAGLFPLVVRVAFWTPSLSMKGWLRPLPFDFPWFLVVLFPWLILASSNAGDAFLGGAIVWNLSLRFLAFHRGQNFFP